METNDKCNLMKLCHTVSTLMYSGKYDQLELLYKSLIEADVIKPIEHLDSEEDDDKVLLMSKFLVAFNRRDAHITNLNTSPLD